MTPLKTPGRLERPIPNRTVAALLVGLPLAYWVKDLVFPWARSLFGHSDHGAFPGFWLSVVVLHWTSVALCVVLLRRHGTQPAELGLPTRQDGLRKVGLLLGAGAALLVIRSQFGATAVFGGTPFFGAGSPVTSGQRLLWVPVAITAGICEEFVYRGLALTLLRRAGLGTRTSVALAALAFALMHGPAGIFGFPFVGTLAVLMSIVYLRTRSLAPGMMLHALLDLSIILTR